ncbi:MAG TPA: hypothetical protein VM911_09590 [Pyrinomonadaceae bacterium]|nr:hypothetical protein [Pyrinomonadaceae bacterium]
MAKQSANLIIPPPGAASAATAAAPATQDVRAERAAPVAQSVVQIKDALNDLWLPAI